MFYSLKNQNSFWHIEIKVCKLIMFCIKSTHKKKTLFVMYLVLQLLIIFLKTFNVFLLYYFSNTKINRFNYDKKYSNFQK